MYFCRPLRCIESALILDEDTIISFSPFEPGELHTYDFGKESNLKVADYCTHSGTTGCYSFAYYDGNLYWISLTDSTSPIWHPVATHLAEAVPICCFFDGERWATSSRLRQRNSSS